MQQGMTKASPVDTESESAMVGHVDLMRDLKRRKDWDEQKRYVRATSLFLFLSFLAIIGRVDNVHKKPL
jgi:hypothetical protein